MSKNYFSDKSSEASNKVSAIDAETVRQLQSEYQKAKAFLADAERAVKIGGKEAEKLVSTKASPEQINSMATKSQKLMDVYNNAKKGLSIAEKSLLDKTAEIRNRSNMSKPVGKEPNTKKPKIVKVMGQEVVEGSKQHAILIEYKKYYDKFGIKVKVMKPPKE